MRPIAAYLRTLMAEPLYWRVASATLGTLVLAFSIALGVACWPPANAVEWEGLFFPVAVGLIGAYLLYAATLGNQATFEQAKRQLDGGSDFAGLLVLLMVGLIALPITVALKLVKRRNASED